MACDCIETVDAKLAEADSNTRLARMFPLVDGQLCMTARVASDQVIRGRNFPAWDIVPTFCPFCGVRYRPAAAEPAEVGHG